MSTRAQAGPRGWSESATPRLKQGACPCARRGLSRMEACGDQTMEVAVADKPDIGRIARVYVEAFPESVKFFFGDSTPERVVKIVSAGFHVLWQAGCGFIVARESDGDVQGYCIIAADEAEVRASFFKNAVWLGFVKDLLRGRIPLRLNEAARLAANGAVLLLSYLVAPRNYACRAGARIFSIAVRKAARGRGLGRELLKRALAFATGKGAKVIKLEVRPENQAAVHLYRSAGFREVGKVKDLQGPWLAMEKTL